MQIIFLSNQAPSEYVDKDGTGKFPEAPDKCPFKECRINIPMKKNGFYTRYLITLDFAGDIRIRRYVCPKCGRTVSMLPSFCIAGYTYSIEFIVSILRQVVETGSIRGTAKEWGCCAENISRRHIRLYMGRLRQSRQMIQYGLNQMSPGSAEIGSSSGDTEWTKRLLREIRPTLSPEFNANFQKATGRSFMSMQKTIA